MNFKNKSLAINSILIVIATSIIATILHELGHFFTASYFDLAPELHHNYVITFKDGTEQQQVFRAAAGPLVSLFSGIIFTYISIRYIKPSLLKLFMLWLGMGSILIFLGYLLIAPIARNGDTGKVFYFLGIPPAISIAIAIVSFIFINWLFSKFAVEFRYYKNEEHFNLNENKKQLFLYPILSSILVMTLLSFPIIIGVSLLPTLFMPMTYFSTMGRYKKLHLTDAELEVNKVSIPLVVITILSIAIFRYLA